MKYLEKKRDNDWTKDKFFDVENIITRKTEGKKNLYLIKWQGYPIADCSWEPISNLTNILDMVDNFEKNFPNSVDQKTLKEFLIEYNRSKAVNVLKKKRKRRKNDMMQKRGPKISEISDIIISINNSDYGINRDEKKEEHKENESDTSNINNIINDVDNFNDNNDNNDSNDLNDKIGKLIKPILI